MPNLKERYAQICAIYLENFCSLMDFPFDTDPWVGSEPGTIAMVGDFFFDFHDVVKYCVDQHLTDLTDLLQWYDYTLWAHENRQTVPNYRSWSRGCPRLSPEQRQKIDDARQRVDELIDEAKNLY